jgi:hypothetical protein
MVKNDCIEKHMTYCRSHHNWEILSNFRYKAAFSLIRLVKVSEAAIF